MVAGATQQETGKYLYGSQHEDTVGGLDKDFQNDLEHVSYSTIEKSEKTPEMVMETATIEKDEGTKLKKLSEAANALEGRIFYIFLTKKNIIEDMIEQRILKHAKR